jgi:hypothetical protein
MNRLFLLIGLASAILLSATTSQAKQDDGLTGKLYAIGTEGNLGVWNGTGWTRVDKKWLFKSPLGRNAVNQVASDLSGKLWLTGVLGDVVTYDGYKKEARGEIGNWSVKRIAFDDKGVMWAVGTGSNIGKWNGTNWDDKGHMGGWGVKSIAFDDKGSMWAVGTESNIGKWNGTSWDDKGHMGGWGVTSIAFKRAQRNSFVSARGAWVNVCSSVNCEFDKSTAETHSKGEVVTNSETNSTEVTKEISVGLELKGFSAGGSVSETEKDEITKSVTTDISNSVTHTLTQKFYTPKFRKENHIVSIWQYVIFSKMTNGSEVTTKTRFYGCSSDEFQPKVFPGTRKNANSCQGGLIPTK